MHEAQARGYSCESQGSEVLKGYIAKLVAEGTGSGGSKASQGW